MIKLKQITTWATEIIQTLAKHDRDKVSVKVFKAAGIWNIYIEFNNDENIDTVIISDLMYQKDCENKVLLVKELIESKDMTNLYLSGELDD